jgi:NAD(P)-dependent dehydrogenase (short-subunit alcohol dehydrogenase family)
MGLPDFSLKNKVAVITGGSRGIGRSIALAYAHAGADVAVVSRKMGELEKVAEECRAYGNRATAITAHAAKINELEAMVKSVMNYYGRIDILVNNAGTNPMNMPVMQYEEKLWDSVMNLNLKGVVFLSKMVANIMKAQGGGSIINIASIEAFMVGHLSCAYDVSKAGIAHFTRIAAVEMAAHNIRVNSIAPGLTKTALVGAWWGDKNSKIEKSIADGIPLQHRLADPDEITGAAVYLASSASSYTTGTCIVIDGGSTLSTKYSELSTN